MKIEKLEVYIENNENVIIAIDGPSGSGKSTLSSYLEEKYDVTVFHVDDYFLPLERKTPKRLSEPGGNFDYERMRKEVFNHITESHIISNKYNCMTGNLEARSPIKKKSIVVVEGVYSLHPTFRKYYNYTVFLDIARPIQLDRILKRSNEVMLQRFIKEFIPLEDLYFDFLNLRKHVDLLVENSQDLRF